MCLHTNATFLHTLKHTASSHFLFLPFQGKKYYLFLHFNYEWSWSLETHRNSSLFFTVFWQGTSDLIKFINFIYSTDPHWVFTMLDTRKTGERPVLHDEELTGSVWADSQYALHTVLLRDMPAPLWRCCKWLTDRRENGQGPGGRCCLCCLLSS